MVLSSVVLAGGCVFDARHIKPCAPTTLHLRASLSCIIFSHTCESVLVLTHECFVRTVISFITLLYLMCSVCLQWRLWLVWLVIMTNHASACLPNEKQCACCCSCMYADCVHMRSVGFESGHCCLCADRLCQLSGELGKKDVTHKIHLLGCTTCMYVHAYVVQQ